AYTVLHVTTTPDDHQHHVIKELLRPHGIHVTETRNPATGPGTPHTHPDDDHPDSPHHSNSDSDSDSDSDRGDGPRPMDLDPQDTTRDQQPPAEPPGSPSIQDVLEGRTTTTSRTITAEDLAAVALNDLETLRRQDPQEPDHTHGYDPAKAADYAMALALAPTTLTTPLNAKDFLEQLAEQLKTGTRTVIASSLLFGSGARIKLQAGKRWVSASVMKTTFDLFWQAKKDRETPTAPKAARLLIGDGPGDAVTVGWLVRGYWMAAGLGDYFITPNGARDVVRKAVYELADMFTTADKKPDPRLIAQRIYAAGEEPLENQVLIVEEFLRQHAENPAPLTTTSDTSAPTDLDAIPLDDLEKLRDAAPDLPAEPFSDPRLAADYGTALALSHSRSEAALDHAPHNKYLTQGSDKYFHTAAGLLFAGGAKLKFNRESEKHLNSKFLRQSIDIAYQQQSSNRPHTPASAAKAMGSNGAAIYVRGFWMAAGLGDYAITENGARDVVRKAVRKLADAFTSAGKEPDASLIAQRVYSPGRMPEAQHVVMVEEFLRQFRAMGEFGGAASDGGLDTVSLDDLDRLRGAMPEPPRGEEYDQELAGDYAAHLALLQSPDDPPIEPSAHAKHFAPPTLKDSKKQIILSRAVLFASGAQVTMGRNNKSEVTVDRMRPVFALAGQVGDKGKPLTMSEAGFKIGNMSAKYVVQGFWLAAGLRGDGPRQGGARDVMRKAVGTLADALTSVGKEPDAWLIAQRVYAPGMKPREQQVALVEELLRQREEATEHAPPVVAVPVEADGLGGVRVGVRVGHAGAGRLRAVLQVRGAGTVEVLPGGTGWQELPAPVRKVLGDQAVWRQVQLAVSDASVAWPQLGSLIGHDAPESVELDRAGLGALAGAALKLAESGVEVLWPKERMSWLSSTVKIHRTGQNTAYRPPDSQVGSEALLSFDWQLSLDDGSELTVEEMDILIASQMPAVLLREQWVLVDEEVVAKALKARRALQGGGLLPESLEADAQDPALLIEQAGQPPRTGEQLVVPSLARELKDYQAQGVRWMTKVAALGLGGILADEMGLG
ncbi:SNF2 helicase-associated domain-containing protein, partial [Streptomyces viridochromogenes]